MYYDFQHQILIGTILGGSSLVKPPKGKNYYVSMRSNQKLWLEYKMMQMPLYFKTASIHKYATTFRCNSCCSPTLTELYGTMYSKGRRTVTMPILDSLKDIAFAIWFLEGGSKTGRNRKNAYLNTTKFGEKGTNLIQQFFNEVGMPCNLNRDGHRLKILFTVDGTETFLKTIAHHFPNFMFDRLN